MKPITALVGACVAAAITAASLGACARGEDGYLESIERMESPRSGGRRESAEASEARIEEIRQAIARYRREVDRTVEATAQIGVYYKMLALQYMQREMYGAAYDSLAEAIRIHPENPILFYYSGVCAARMSRAVVDAEARALWLERSEGLYRRAVALDPRYVDALYALAVLLALELDRPEEAEGPVQRILEIEAGNVEAMFLLGNVYYRTGRLEEALVVYREIQEKTTVAQRREEALANQQKIREELYGGQ